MLATESCLGITAVKKEVYEQSGQWSWRVTTREGRVSEGHKHASYHDADEEADEVMWLAIAADRRLRHFEQLNRKITSLAALSLQARQVLKHCPPLVDAEVLAELADALQRGIFDHGPVDGPFAKGEVVLLLASYGWRQSETIG
jgi:hypothetical protein